MTAKSPPISQLNRPTSRELELAAHRERSLLLGAAIVGLARKVPLAFASRPKPDTTGRTRAEDQG
jgi:hypothetical protein